MLVWHAAGVTFAPISAPPRPYSKPATPYCGFLARRTHADGRGSELYVPYSAAHCRLGPTETGKTRRLLAPQAVLWNGPACVVSSKDDLMQLVMERRYGPRALIDLRPIKSPVYPHGVTALESFDPTVSIDSPAEALTVAETIMQMSTVGLGSGADQVSDGGIWKARPRGRWPRSSTPHPPPHPSTATAWACRGC